MKKLILSTLIILSCSISSFSQDSSNLTNVKILHNKSAFNLKLSFNEKMPHYAKYITIDDSTSIKNESKDKTILYNYSKVKKEYTCLIVIPKVNNFELYLKNDSNEIKPLYLIKYFINKENIGNVEILLLKDNKYIEFDSFEIGNSDL